MIRYECDRCGLSLGANDAQRFIVKIEVYAAAGHVDLDAEASGDTVQKLAEVLNDLASADPDEVEDKTYRCFHFDVCDACRRKIMLAPLG